MIPGFFDIGAGGPVPRVRAAVLLADTPGQGRPRWSTVDFLVDTGASSICLHPLAAVLVGIPATALVRPDLWPSREDHRGIGGEATYFVVPCTYAFREEGDRLRRIEGQIAVAQLTESNQRLPSLLGWGVLQQFDVRLNWRMRTVGLY